MISVIICSHNPRNEYLLRTLDALRSQTLTETEWELLLIDNASSKILSSEFDISWHHRARHIREEELGLTPARLRGIQESAGELLVFVDDDNVLSDEYLKTALTISQTHPHIGAFGGSIQGEFETPPPEWIAPYLSGLVISELQQNYWSNVPGWSLAVPYGAGLCVRKSVAMDYRQKAKSDPKRKSLGRKGIGLGAGEDTDIAWCAIDLGMGTGRFSALKMTHLIPSSRLTQTYIVQLFAGFAGSGVLLDSLRNGGTSEKKPLWLDTLQLLWKLSRATHVERQIALASYRARRKAVELLRTLPA